MHKYVTLFFKMICLICELISTIIISNSLLRILMIVLSAWSRFDTWITDVMDGNYKFTSNKEEIFWLIVIFGKSIFIPFTYVVVGLGIKGLGNIIRTECVEEKVIINVA
jgi:hypothetical protein